MGASQSSKKLWKVQLWKYNQNYNNQSISLEEAYKILNLNPKKKYTKDRNAKK